MIKNFQVIYLRRRKSPTVINVKRFTHFQKEKQNVLDQFQYLD